MLRQEKMADERRRPRRGRMYGPSSSSKSSSTSVEGVSGVANSRLGVVAGTGDAELLVEGVVDTDPLLSEPLLTELLLIELLGAGLTLKGRLLPELKLGDEGTAVGGLSTMVMVVVVGGELGWGGVTDGVQLGGGLMVMRPLATEGEAGVGLLLVGDTGGFLGGTGAGLFLFPAEPESVDDLGGLGAGAGAVVFFGGVHTGVGVLPVLLGAGDADPEFLAGVEELCVVEAEEIVEEVSLLLLLAVMLVETEVAVVLLALVLLLVAVAVLWTRREARGSCVSFLSQLV